MGRIFISCKPPVLGAVKFTQWVHSIVAQAAWSQCYQFDISCSAAESRDDLRVRHDAFLRQVVLQRVHARVRLPPALLRAGATLGGGKEACSLLRVHIDADEHAAVQLDKRVIV